HILRRQHARIVPVSVCDVCIRRATRIILGWQPVGGNVVAVITELDQCRPAAVIFRVGETWYEHSARQSICAVRSNCSSGSFREFINGLYMLRLRRIGVHVEYEHAAGVKAGPPELAPVVGEAAVVGFVAPIDGGKGDDFAVLRRSGPNVDGDQLVRAVAHSLYTERPDIDELFLPIDASEIR